MTMELLETEDSNSGDIDQRAKYSTYVSKFLKPDPEVPDSVKVIMGESPVFLARNVLTWKKISQLEFEKNGAKLMARSLNPEPMDIKVENEDDNGIGEVVIKQEVLDPAEVPMDVQAGPSHPVVAPVASGSGSNVVIKVEDNDG